MSNELYLKWKAIDAKNSDGLTEISEGKALMKSGLDKCDEAKKEREAFLLLWPDFKNPATPLVDLPTERNGSTDVKVEAPPRPSPVITEQNAEQTPKRKTFLRTYGHWSGYGEDALASMKVVTLDDVMRYALAHPKNEADVNVTRTIMKDRLRSGLRSLVDSKRAKVEIVNGVLTWTSLA